MPRVCRSTIVSATPETLWEIVGDPYHLPRWWPRVTRVEAVDADGFTQVLETDKGRPVRADFRVVESVEPRRCRWTQQLAGTPFERILRAVETEVRLEPHGGGTTVTLTLVQRLRGMARLGAFMLRAAGNGQLEEALAGLRRLVEPPEDVHVQGAPG